VVSCESLYGLYQHPIDPQHESLVELVEGEVLDVLVNDDGGPGVVDAVATIFTRKSAVFRLEQRSHQLYIFHSLFHSWKHYSFMVVFDIFNISEHLANSKR